MPSDCGDDDHGGGSAPAGFELQEDPSFWKDNNVQVVIRVRPLSSGEISVQGQKRCVRQDSCQSITWTGHPESRFKFDLVADEYVTQVHSSRPCFSVSFRSVYLLVLRDV
jgi:kinesin family protein 15